MDLYLVHFTFDSGVPGLYLCHIKCDRNSLPMKSQVQVFRLTCVHKRNDNCGEILLWNFQQQQQNSIFGVFLFFLSFSPFITGLKSLILISLSHLSFSPYV